MQTAESETSFTDCRCGARHVCTTARETHQRPATLEVSLAGGAGNKRILTTVVGLLLQLSLHATGSPPYCELCAGDLVVRKQSRWWLLLAAFVLGVLNLVFDGWLFVLPSTFGHSWQ